MNAVRMNSVSYPNILQFAGKLTDFMLFLLPRFSLSTHLAIAHNNFKHNVPQNMDRLAEYKRMGENKKKGSRRKKCMHGRLNALFAVT